MMSFESNTIHFDPSKIHEIEEKLELDGCVRVQFTEEHLPEDYHVKENIELFFIGLIEKLGGQCLKHNTDTNSIVWHVQPNTQSPNGKHNKLARSETFEEFAFHTDCSYEENPPEYIAMLVLETDKLGGGQTEIIRLSDVLEHLPAETIEKLLSEKVQINVPEEFRKQSHIDHISETILLDPNRIRYREDILSGKSLEHVDQLRLAINQAPRYKPNLEKYTMILLNNQTYLHGRTKVLDQRRHLLRIRFNRLPPYNIFSILDHAKFMREHLTFESEFYSYFDQQHENLHKILKLIVEQYSQPTHLGEEIRQTFAFKPKTHDILMQLNLHKPDFCTGSYRPDVILGPGDLFRMNGVQPFRPKMCEINGRFPLNGYLMSVSVLFNDHPNQCAERFSRLLDTIIKSAKLDTSKPLFILKGRERGFDVHCFQKYWTKKYSRPCSFIDPNRLTVKNNLLFDAKGNHVIEQCILELHQDEILQLSDDVLQVLIRSEELNYFNDLRTIFLLHDKRLFTLLSNQEFLYALLNQVPQQFIDFIPSTFVVSKIPNYLKDCIINNKHDWCIKPNLFGKGEDVTMGRQTEYFTFFLT